MSNLQQKQDGTEWISRFTNADPTRSASHARYNWYTTYMAALFEEDKTQISGRIAEAEKLLVERERQLFTSAMDANERRAIIAALHALAALRGCLRSHEHLPSHAA